jgi:heme A synthase
MDANQSRLVGAGLFFLLIFLSGFWLNRLGKPYPSIVLTIHKLIALAAVVFLVMTVYRMHKDAPLSPVEITAFVVTLLFFVSNIATGGLLSIAKPIPAAVSTMHKLFPYLTVLSTAVTLYLLLGRKL